MTNRRRARVVGMLFIIATAFLFIGQAVYRPVLGDPGSPGAAYQHQTRVVAGILLEFVCVVAILLIPAVLFPLLRRRHESRAIGYVAFRLLEAVLFVLAEAFTLVSVALSAASARDGGANAAQYRALSMFAGAVHDRLFSFYALVFAAGAILLYSAFHSSRLLPRALTIWGMAGAMFLGAGTLLVIAGVFAGRPVVAVEAVLALPIALQEMVMAVWLIVRGFHRPGVPVRSSI